LSALLVVAIAVTGWILFQFFYNSGPNPYFVPIWVSAYEKTEIPPIPWIDADRKAIRDGGVFATVDPDVQKTTDLPLAVIQTRLQYLSQRDRDDAVVVYLGAYAVVNPDGKIQILAKDSSPYHSKNQLSLSSVLNELRKCPVKHKLLVLDIMHGMI